MQVANMHRKIKHKQPPIIIEHDEIKILKLATCSGCCFVVHVSLGSKNICILVKSSEFSYITKNIAITLFAADV